MRRLVIVILSAFLLITSGCAKLNERGSLYPPTTEEAIHVAPFSIRLTVNAGKSVNGNVDTHRVTAVMWGNDLNHIRMDINAGIGAILARCVETDKELNIYIPNEEILFVRNKETQLQPVIMGIEFPFYLSEIAMLSLGSIKHLLNHKANGHVKSTTSDGRPLKWIDKNGWIVEFMYRDSSNYPYKIKANKNDDSQTEAIILIKQVQVAPKFSSDQMQIDVPIGVTIK